ncbi:MAG: hypothetical protein J6K45_04555 [Clostridia bacterium]|nr:hypothetical protein [Clostridia bacterium]
MILDDEDRCEELENIIDDLESYANDLNDLKAGFISKDIKGDIKDIVAEINAVKEKYIEKKEEVEERLLQQEKAENMAQIIEFERSRL